MGVQLGDIVVKEKLELSSLAGRKVAIDAYNALYQFLSIIRQKDGTPLMDSHGHVTSHLSGIFYRTARLLEIGIKPIYVFDGKPPALKHRTIAERVEVRLQASEKWQKAKAAGDLEGARKYAQASSRLTGEMVAESKELLEAMGLPFVQAPSEGEAQAAWMAREHKVDLCCSQDFDALLFGAPQLARNLTISGRRKLPGKDVYVDVEPELIDLEASLKALGIDRNKLIWIGILIGTDFNEGVKGIGPKKALKIVQGAGNLAEAVEASKGEFEVEPSEIENFFLHPPIEENVNVEFGMPDRKKLVEFLCRKHDFSEERIGGVADAIAKKANEKGEQSSLERWSQ
ncbi:MAG: flap endonuclease-1 [Candidatus Burarchaeum sp.]|nr:flap endonuclease-1 [Candidatus Burarchaeum sp.]MDO8339403.1 flap endonuclease-1 [Candidatus Burarchaeum sp.]